MDFVVGTSLNVLQHNQLWYFRYRSSYFTHNSALFFPGKGFSLYICIYIYIWFYFSSSNLCQEGAVCSLQEWPGCCFHQPEHFCLWVHIHPGHPLALNFRILLWISESEMMPLVQDKRGADGETPRQEELLKAAFSGFKCCPSPPLSAYQSLLEGNRAFKCEQIARALYFPLKMRKAGLIN